ncbi:MAG: UxaA family hydrolase [Planctomycetota bacterium]
MKLQAIVIDGKDNVATVVGGTLAKGRSIGARLGSRTSPVRARTAIRPGHKIALRGIAKGEQVMKYGQSIGTATKSILKGDWVHVHNVESNRGRGDRVAAKQ